MDDELPPGWAWATLGDVLLPRRCKIPSDPQSSLPFLGLEHIPANSTRPIGFGKFADMRSAASQFLPGDVLYGRLRPYLNKVWKADRRGAASAEFIVFPERSDFDNEFLALLLHGGNFVSFAKHAVSGDRPRIDVSEMAAFRFPIPPRREQARIAAEVNRLFAELDEAEAALARAREGVEQFRASLLHAACTGALTASWREANPPTETGADLLARILAERRVAWERTERARLEAKGTPPKNDAWKARYVEPAAPNPTGMPDLPHGWAWVLVDHLIREPPRNGVSVQGSPHPPGIPALRLDALGEDGLRFDRRRYIKIPDAKASALYIGAQDFLVSRANGSPALVARACVAGTPPDNVIFPDTMIRFRLHRFVRPMWLAQIWKSDLVRSQILNRAKTSAGILKVSQDDLLAIRVPITTIEEQDAGLAAIRELIDSVRDVDTLGSDRSHVALRQSILHAAFTGRLVPQDPSDEPASALLARLRASSAAPRRQPRLTRRV